MQITDPVADMLTRIRNANSAKHDTVDVPASNLKKAIAQILQDEGYIKSLHGGRQRQPGRHPHHPEVSWQRRRRSSPACAASPSPACVCMPGADELPKVLQVASASPSFPLPRAL